MRATIHEATAADAEPIGRLLHDFHVEFDEPTPGAAVLGERAGRLIARGEAVFLLAGEDGIAQLRFRASVWTGRQDCTLEDLYVRPAVRGRGIGRAVLDAAIELARTRDAAFMEIAVSDDDTTAVALYERSGFAYHESGEPDAPAYRFYLREL